MVSINNAESSPVIENSALQNKGPDIEQAVKLLKEQQLPTNYVDYSRSLEQVSYFSNNFEDKKVFYIQALQTCGEINKCHGKNGVSFFCAVAKVLGDKFPSDKDKIVGFVNYIATSTKEPHKTAYEYIACKFNDGTLDRSDEEDLLDIYGNYVPVVEEKQTTDKKEQTADKKEQTADKKEYLRSENIEKQLKKLNEILSNPANAQANAKFKELMQNAGLNPENDEDKIKFISNERHRSLIGTYVTPLVKHDKESFSEMFPSKQRNPIRRTDDLNGLSQTMKTDPDSRADFQASVDEVKSKIPVKGQNNMSSQSKVVLAEMTMGNEQFDQKSNQFLSEVFRKDPSQRNPKTNQIIGDKTLDQLNKDEKQSILEAEGFFDNLIGTMTSELQKYAAEQIMDASGRQARACIEAFQNQGNMIENVKFKDGAITCDMVVKNGDLEFTQHCKFENGKFIVTDIFDKQDGTIKPVEKELMRFSETSTLASSTEIDLSGAKDIKDKDELKRYIDKQIALKISGTDSLKLGEDDELRKYSDQQSFKMAMKNLYFPKDQINIDNKSLNSESNKQEYRFLKIALDTVRTGKYSLEGLTDTNLKDFLETTQKYSANQYPQLDTLKVLDDLGIISKEAGGSEIIDIEKLKKLNQSLIAAKSDPSDTPIEELLGVNLSDKGYQIKKTNITNGLKSQIWLERA